MYDNLRFFNWYGNGDLFNSREFIKELMKKIPASKYWYHHPKYPRMFEDISELEYAKITKDCSNAKGFIKKENDLYINTWIGRENRYVLEGIGCTVRKNLEMYNNILSSAGLSVRLEKSPEEYLPRVDFSKLELENVDTWVRENQEKRIVLLCTNRAQSCQSSNFDMLPTLDRIFTEFKDIVFVVTDDCPEYPNVFRSKDITKTVDGFDLNEISYLSLFADTIIGRPTGPFVFCQNMDNCMNKDKKVLGFSFHQNSVTFAHDVPIKMSVFWSGATSNEEVYLEIKEILEK